MIFGVILLIIGCYSLYKVIKYPTKDEEEILYNDLRGWSIAIGGILGGFAIIIKELIKYFK